MRDKKSLYLITIGTLLASTIAVAAYSASNLKVFDSLAGGIVQTSDKGRTLTLDNTTPVAVDGSVGTLTVGNMSAYGINCSEIDNGVVKLSNGGFVIYCNDAALYESTSYQGFGNSKIDSVSITLNNNNRTGDVTIAWGKIDTDNNITFYSSGSKHSISFTATPQTKEVTMTKSDSPFVAYQNDPKLSGFSCIYIAAKTTDLTFDLINLTVQYTCN